jgi:hypothetical protein
VILLNILFLMALGSIDGPAMPEPSQPMFATRYDPGVMERVARYRGIELTGCGMAIDNHRPGSFVMVHGVKTGVRRLCRVVDWSKPRDKARHVRNRLLELDHESQLRICGKAVQMSGWRECPVLIVRIGE